LVGPVRPLNAGTKSARGQIIALLGDDDEWVPGHIEESIAALRNSGAEWVSGWSTDIDAGGQTTTNRGYEEGGNMVGPVATWVYASYLSFAKWNIHSWRKGWDRPNDIDLAKRFLRMGVRHASVSQVGAIWKPRPGESLLGVAAYMENPEVTVDKFSIKAPSLGKKSKEG
jgi:glycosyltransferase involved in cell wall biosynthesis